MERSGDGWGTEGSRFMSVEVGGAVGLHKYAKLRESRGWGGGGSFIFMPPSDLSRGRERSQTERTAAVGQNQGPSVKTPKASCGH